jgi:hypothetical protein
MSAILFALFIASLFLHARAAAVFKDRRVTLLDTKGVKRPWDHLRQLTEAVDCVARAMAKA